MASDSSQEEGLNEYELNRRYNQLLHQHHELIDNIEKISICNNKVWNSLNKAGERRMRIERESLENTFYMPSTRNTTRLELPDQSENYQDFGTPLFEHLHVDELGPVEIPDAEMVAQLQEKIDRLEREFNKLVNLNSYLSKEYTILQPHPRSQVLLRFFNITDPCRVSPYFVCCSWDDTIDDIIAFLPTEWNATLTSQFMGSSEHLCAFNQKGTRLKDHPELVPYLELRGLVFVSTTATKTQADAVSSKIPESVLTEESTTKEPESKEEPVSTSSTPNEVLSPVSDEGLDKPSRKKRKFREEEEIVVKKKAERRRKEAPPRKRRAVKKDEKLA